MIPGLLSNLDFDFMNIGSLPSSKSRPRSPRQTWKGQHCRDRVFLGDRSLTHAVAAAKISTLRALTIKPSASEKAMLYSMIVTILIAVFLMKYSTIIDDAGNTAAIMTLKKWVHALIFLSLYCQAPFSLR